MILPATIFLILTSELLFETLRLQNFGIETTSLVLLFPALYGVFGITAALIVVAFKWILMGRYRPLESPLWSAFVWRTELVTSLFENLAGPFLIDLLKGTPFLAGLSAIARCKIGRRVFLNSSEVTEFDLVEIGDDAALNNECTIQTHLFEDRVMKMSTVKIGGRLFRWKSGGRAVRHRDARGLDAQEPLAPHERRGFPSRNALGRKPSQGHRIFVTRSQGGPWYGSGESTTPCFVGSAVRTSPARNTKPGRSARRTLQNPAETGRFAAVADSVFTARR